MTPGYLCYGVVFFALIGLPGPVLAQYPELGAKVDAFQLLGTDDQLYGIKEGEDKVSILFFVGHT